MTIHFIELPFGVRFSEGIPELPSYSGSMPMRNPRARDAYGNSWHLLPARVLRGKYVSR